jgi:acylphosphatase
MNRQEHISPQSTLRLSIRGRIQGVGFRYWASSQALHLKIKGWVRNEADGSVSCECQGTADAVQAFVEAVREGPSHARVDKVDANPIEQTRVYRRFEIIG